ncbi:hypothetical protein RGC36_06020 [Helicobacter pylori]|nr:hypothetical protein [Helicobacter pylori]
MSEEVMVNIIGLGSIDITRICIFVVFIKKSNMTFKLSSKKRESHSIHAHIDDIQYNVLDSTFYFIFDVCNPLLKKPSQLIVEVPREALDLENADRLVKDTLSPYNYSQSSFVYHISEGSYIIDLHLIDD